MTKVRSPMFLAVAVLCLTGCFEVEQEYTLNPDGSGKVVHRVRQPDMMGQGEAGLKQLLSEQLEGARGVDVWSDVNVRLTDEGSLEFVGTAYFSDLNALFLKNADAFRFGWDRDAKGAGKLHLIVDEADTGTTAGTGEVATEIADARKEWIQMRPMMQGLLGSFRWVASFHLPSDVLESVAFQKAGPRTVSFEMKGERYFEVIDSLMQDEAFLEAQAKRGLLGAPTPGSEAIPAEIVPRLFGEEGIYAVTAPALTPAFDYGAAVTSAEEQFETMMATLPVVDGTGGKAVPPARGGDFRSLQVIQSSFVTNGELAWQEEGASFSIAGELPGSVIAMESGKLLVATADTGDDLLPESEWTREVSASLDSEDPTRVKFDVRTKLPPERAKGLREISGVLLYKTATEPEEQVELFHSIATGPGSALGATMGEREPGYTDGSQQVTIEIAAPREEISEILFFDANGEPLQVQHLGTSWTDDSTSLTYMIEGEFPPEGRVAAKVRRGVQTYEIPFKISNIDLMGRPLK